MRSSRIAVGVSIALAGAYEWWLAGLRPFTTTAYLAIALPTALLIAALALPRPGGGTTRGAADEGSPTPSGRQLLPLAIVLLLGLGLEIAGLALGGRSALVPTFSTILDHLLRWQFVRYLLILAWLAIGFLLARRSWRQRITADGG
jgi:hypothetical protein